LADFWNYVDILHIALGYANLWCQKSLGTWHLTSKSMMITVTAICLIKTFFFMRIIKGFSQIVTMIIVVVSDLRTFLIFYVLLIFMFSLVFDIIAPSPAEEYEHVGRFMGNAITSLRMSLGDFDFGILRVIGGHAEILPKQHIMFWVAWLIMVIASSFIFINFVIAEVTNSYYKVK
jgi:hypothetical protein